MNDYRVIAYGWVDVQGRDRGYELYVYDGDGDRRPGKLVGVTQLPNYGWLEATYGWLEAVRRTTREFLETRAAPLKIVVGVIQVYREVEDE